MSGRSVQRYGDVAVIFHWLIALFILALLAVGKYMVGLEDNDPVRFVLTQWHKSFGITVLILSVLRLLWRFTHRPPPELDSIPGWQQRVASLVHVILYALMFILPITGWIMVSASPLNIDTVLFNVIPWPHLPVPSGLEAREAIALSFAQYHELAGMALIAILLAHIGAALKHHFVDNDVILVRMLPQWRSSSLRRKLTVLLATVCASVAGLLLYADSGNQAALLAAGDSEVSFIADVTGEQTAGVFTQSTVEALIDEQDPANSSVLARVQVGSFSSANSQVEGSLPDTEWFDVENYPEALFQSTQIEPGADGALLVTGDLTIKNTTQAVTFPMTLSDEDDKRVARGEFLIDRRDFAIGMESQDTDDYVGFEVMVKFRFDISTGRAEGA